MRPYRLCVLGTSGRPWNCEWSRTMSKPTDSGTVDEERIHSLLSGFWVPFSSANRPGNQKSPKPSQVDQYRGLMPEGGFCSSISATRSRAVSRILETSSFESGGSTVNFWRTSLSAVIILEIRGVDLSGGDKVSSCCK